MAMAACATLKRSKSWAIRTSLAPLRPRCSVLGAMMTTMAAFWLWGKKKTSWNKLVLEVSFNCGNFGHDKMMAYLCVPNMTPCLEKGNKE